MKLRSEHLASAAALCFCVAILGLMIQAFSRGVPRDHGVAPLYTTTVIKGPRYNPARATGVGK